MPYLLGENVASVFGECKALAEKELYYFYLELSKGKGDYVIWLVEMYSLQRSRNNSLLFYHYPIKTSHRLTNFHNLDYILTRQTSDYSFDFPGPLILGTDVPCR